MRTFSLYLSALYALGSLLCTCLALADTVPPWSMGQPLITYGNYRGLPPDAPANNPCAVYSPGGEGYPQLENAYGWPSQYDPTTLTTTIAQQTSALGFNLAAINDPSQPRSGASQLQIAGQSGMRAQLLLGEPCSPTNVIFGLVSPTSSCTLGNWQSSCWPTPAAASYLNTLISEFQSSPAAYSYALADEPCVRPSPGSPLDPTNNAGDACGSKMPLLAAISAYIGARDPTRLIYVNLLPPSYGPPELTFSSTSTSSGTTYSYTTYTSWSAYLADFVNQVHPSLLSYDSYPFKTNTQGTPYDDIAFLTDAQTVAQASVQYSIPFMAYVQGISLNLGVQLRVPTATQLDYEANALLAFGAHGISYFNYWCLGGPSCGGIAPNYTSGTPTTVDNELQSLNPHFRRIAARLQGLRWMGTYLKGYSPVPAGLAGLPGNPTFDIPALQNNMTWSPSPSGPSSTSGPPMKGALIGYFGIAGSRPALAYVVNLDYTNGYTYRVTGPGPMSVFNASTGGWTPTGQPYADVTLTPGGGVLVGLTSSTNEATWLPEVIEQALQ